MRCLWVWSVLIAGISVVAKPSIPFNARSTRYPQIFSDRYTLKGLPKADWPALPITKTIDDMQLIQTTDGSHEAMVLISNDGALWMWSPDQSTAVAVSIQNGTVDIDGAYGMTSAVISGSGYLVLAGSAGIGVYWLECTSKAVCTLVAHTPFPPATSPSVTSLAFDPATCILWVGTLNDGLYRSQQCLSSSLPLIRDAAVPLSDGSIATIGLFDNIIGNLDGATLTVSTVLRLWTLNTVTNVWHYDWIGGIIDDPIVSFAANGTSGTLFGSNDYAINYQTSPDKEYGRYGPSQGLPTANLTSLLFVDDPRRTMGGGGLWVGSLWGLNWLQSHPFDDSTYSRWRFFAGGRWLVDNCTVAMECWPSKGWVFVSTEQGLSVFSWKVWTLQDKADALEAMIRPRHDRYGFVASVSLSRWGDPTSYTNGPGESDGLWSSIYLTAESLRYAVTSDESARQNAWRTFAALELLHNVTGITGLPARAVSPTSQPRPSGKWWHNSTSMPTEWYWMGDTSSDDITGHLFAIPAVYHLVAKSETERARVRKLYCDTVDYIIAGNFTLIDITGEHTTWGVWNPDYLNSFDWLEERGVNALQILQYLLSAYDLSGGDIKYLTAFTALGESASSAYFDNIINEKINVPMQDNYSDDELVYLPFFGIFISSVGVFQQLSQQIRQAFQKSLHREWVNAANEAASLWTFITAAANLNVSDPTQYGPGDRDITTAMHQLQRWPLEQIDWPVDNSVRWDIDITKELSRDWPTAEIRSVAPLPLDELIPNRWNADPFLLKVGSGYQEFDSGAYLLAYWLGRFLGYLSD